MIRNKEIPEEIIKKCVGERVNNIISSQIITFDLLLTTSGYILSLFLIIFSAITSQGFLLFVGVVGFVPVVIHTIDGVTRRKVYIKSYLGKT